MWLIAASVPLPLSSSSGVVTLWSWSEMRAFIRSHSSSLIGRRGVPPSAAKDEPVPSNVAGLVDMVQVLGLGLDGLVLPSPVSFGLLSVSSRSLALSGILLDALGRRATEPLLSESETLGCLSLLQKSNGPLLSESERMTRHLADSL